MSQPPSPREMLGQFRSVELEAEIVRRLCESDGHPPYEWHVIREYGGAVVKAMGSCQCGHQSYEAVPVE